MFGDNFGTKTTLGHPEYIHFTRISLERHKMGMFGEIFAFWGSWEREITLFGRLG
jgi:hypothetical protein